MTNVSRRTFFGVSLGAISALHINPEATVAATSDQCSPAYAPSAFVPTSLQVDCASPGNFRLFQQNTDYLGLTGVVSLNRVQGKYGAYDAGNLFLFPWLKPKGLALGVSRSWPSNLSIGNGQMIQSSAINVASFTPDEYFLRYVMVVPTTQFIAFTVDVPFDAADARRAWMSNVDKLADGSSAGINWGSNFNKPWFAGGRAIPADDQCQGSAWRKVIVAGLSQASVAAC